MRIKCLRILSLLDKSDQGAKTNYLTVGKEYIVLVIYFKGKNLSFQIEDDSGDITIFEADQFEITSNYIPTNWEINFDVFPSGAYYLELSPKSWNEYYKRYEDYPDSFYEKIIEVETPLESWRGHPGAPEIVEVYFQAKDLIYREEKEYSLKQLQQK